jgi:hypothetical protein
MRRIILSIVALACFGAFTFAVAGASAATPKVKPATKVKAGSTWTFYDVDGNLGSTNPGGGVYTGVCQILSFESGGSYTSDKDAGGTYSETATTISLKFADSYGGYAGTYGSVLTNSGTTKGFEGAETVFNLGYSLDYLIKGDDPEDLGTC